MNLEPLESGLTPEAALARWPRDRPLAALWSGGGASRARWTILAEPVSGASLSVERGRNGLETMFRDVRFPTTANEAAASLADPLLPPFRGGWIGCISYEFGRDLEPSVVPPGTPSKPNSRQWPGAHFVRTDDAVAYDHHRQRWWSIGRGRAILRECERSEPSGVRSFRVGTVRSATGHDRFCRTVERALEYIRAGDVYQVTLSHRLSGNFSGPARMLFGALMEGSQPWFGGYIEQQPTAADCQRRVILSMSPELFLEFDSKTRTVLTRPMKGTRPAGGSADELRAAPKDNAELAMIVDLMRNDLGRVCRFGSIHVEQPRVIEHHGLSGATTGVLQAVAEVRGTLREGLMLADLLHATLPGGSVTGAPKVRAMQIINELEPVDRGPYCGCVGYVSHNGNAAFNIAIRTALLSGPSGASGLDQIDGGILDYSVGAGVVADSDPESEWRETLVKAGVLRHVTDIDTDGSKFP